MTQLLDQADDRRRAVRPQQSLGADLELPPVQASLGPALVPLRAHMGTALDKVSPVDWHEGEELGHGKFGVVHACVPADAPLGAEPEHALKRLKSEYLDDEELRKRFAREIEILASLDHPNLMEVVDHGETDGGAPYLVMPLAGGGSLRDAMGDGRADGKDWWIEVFEGVVAGVAHAHDHGIFHRDLKPRNILLFDDGPCVSDFGIAKQLDLDATTLTKSEQELGTLRYMAPEQFASVKDAEKPADVYALGKIFAHLITGITPEPMKVEVHKVPERFRFFVDKCCRDDPSSRYPDGAGVSEGFEKSRAGYEIVLPPDEHLSELAEKAADALGTVEEAQALDELSAHVRANRDHEKMNTRGIPYLPNELLRAWSAYSPDGFREAMGVTTAMSRPRAGCLSTTATSSPTSTPPSSGSPPTSRSSA